MADAARLPRVTVVVVTYDSADVVGDCLRSLPAAFADAARPSIVVVDNASSDGTVGAVREAAPDALLLRMATNRGYAAAINAGVEGAPGGVGDALLVLNPDVRMAAGSVAPLLAALRQPGVGMAVPRLVDQQGRLQWSLRREPTVLRAFGEALLGGGRAGRWTALGEVVSDPRVYQHPGPAVWATGAVLAISLECLRATGPWDESFFLYSEEVDFALRAAEGGHGLWYEPAASAVHIGGASGTDERLWALLTRNRIELYRRRHGPLRSAAFTGGVVLNEALRAAAGRRTSRAALRSLVRRDHARPDAPPIEAPPGIICFSAQDWWYFNRAHSDFQLVTRLARQRPVLLVNSLGMRMPLPGRTRKPLARLGRKLASLSKGLRHPLPDVPGLAVLTPLFLPVYRPGRLRDASNRFVAWQVGRAAGRSGITRADLVVTLPTAWEVAARLPRRVLIANRSDRYGAFAEADGAWVGSLERTLLAHADAAVYASQTMLEAEADATRRATFLDHGVDLERFTLASDLTEPADLAAIGRPRIGFFGAIDDYTVDLALLEQVADALPDARLVLVGPTNCPLGDLLRRPNVHWLGPRPAEEIPAYGSGFDVALMPWLDNEWIRHCNPIKLKEYLALGLPTVSTSFPEVERYSSVVRVARDPEHFVALVRQSLLDGGPATPERRRATVQDDSWDRRAAELLELLDDVAARPEEDPACVAS
jgi:GT2 family glycosyltransferase